MTVACSSTCLSTSQSTAKSHQCLVKIYRCKDVWLVWYIYQLCN